MAGALRPMGGGHGKYPLVRGIGTIAIHRALVAAYLAQNYLDNDDRGVRFLVVPRFVQEETQTGSGFRNQLVLKACAMGNRRAKRPTVRIAMVVAHVVPKYFTSSSSTSSTSSIARLHDSVGRGCHDGAHHACG